MTYTDLAPVASLAQPLLNAQGMDALAQRLANALTTLGTSGGVTVFTAGGTETHSIRKLGPSDKDPALYALLSSSTPASTDPLGFTPSDALSVNSSAVDLGAWWDFLGGLVASVPQLGVTDLNQFVQAMVGVDLKADLFDWSAGNVAIVSTPSPAPLQAGMPSSDVLGSTVFVLKSKDDAAAAKGLSDLFTKLGTQAAGLSNTSGKAAAPSTDTHQAGGVTVTTMTLAPTVKLSYAVAKGHAFIGTSAKALDDVLQATQSGGSMPATLAGMRAKVPAGAHSFSVTDAKATMQNSSASLVTGVQTFAGMSGSQNLDIAKVKVATDALQKFLDFVAAHLGGSYSYQQTSGGTVTSRGLTQVSW